jgi:hypothetical protein
MPGPALCAVCGDELPDDFPGVTTCRGWADTYARERGDLLSEDLYRGLMLMRCLWQVMAALRDGRDRIGEP